MNFKAATHLPADVITAGLPHRRFTVRDVERMVEVGLLTEDDRLELVGGELVEMSPRGNHHERIKLSLLRYWMRRLPDNLALIPETTLRLAGDTLVEPDFTFFPAHLDISELEAGNIPIVVEISDSSLGYDLGVKARIYAHFGIAELWVVDAVKHEIHIHRAPKDSSYTSISVITREETASPMKLPELAVCLADLLP